MSPAAVGDVARMARLLAECDSADPDRICVRGSTWRFMAIHAAAVSDSIAGVIAICPAGEEDLLRGLRRESSRCAPTPQRSSRGSRSTTSMRAVGLAGAAVLLIHARGDEQIPYTRSEELYRHAGEPRKLIVLPAATIAPPSTMRSYTASRWMERALRDCRRMKTSRSR